jgi:hypothetical protein
VIAPERQPLDGEALERWGNDLLAALEHDDDSAAREMLIAGFPIYYREADTPPGLEVKHHPDGRRELVRFHRSGDEVIRALCPASAADSP